MRNQMTPEGLKRIGGNDKQRLATIVSAPVEKWAMGIAMCIAKVSFPDDDAMAYQWSRNNWRDYVKVAEFIGNDAGPWKEEKAKTTTG